MRLKFRSQGQAEQYYKICRGILEENSRGPEDGRLGRELIRNAIYRGFGFRNFCGFQRDFAPNERIAEWFHTEEQLTQAFSLAFEGAIEVARQRRFEAGVAAPELVSLAIGRAVEINDRALQRLIGVPSTSKRRIPQGPRCNRKLLQRN